MPRMLNNWSVLTEEEIMRNSRKGTHKEPAAIRLFAEELVEAEKQYLFKNQTDFGAKMSKEDLENG